ncbi:MAG: hypothetical protein IIC92_11105 [Chloroflexi bacterium]|nr:hypothetical protein [Chloroflexota bacterium]
MRNNWMQALALHYDRIRRRYPDDKLLILFDIDGTIVDMRHLIRHVLRRCDTVHGTTHFAALEIDDITVHENHIDPLLDELAVPQDERAGIMAFWKDERWSSDSMMEAHRPFKGVMDVIRWFQLQPRVEVGLNTGRPEFLRADTLRSLNDLGREHNVSFRDDLLHMNPGDWEEAVGNSKANGVKRFQDAGYLVFAMVDNEPANLAAVAELDGCQDLLPLHAYTIFEGDCRELPVCSESGTNFDLTELASDEDLPTDVQLVWHGVNDRANLRQFLASDVEWGELDVRSDPDTGEFVLHHDSLDTHDDSHVERVMAFTDVVAELSRFEKSIKIDFKEGGRVVEAVLESLAANGFDQSHIWFNANIEILGEEGFKSLRAKCPAAILQCPIDHLVSQIIDSPDEARTTLQELRSWGVSRFSIEWGHPELGKVVDRLNHWGFESNLYNVPDLEGFLQAVLLKPRSVTADFNFPKWHYFGRGSGQDGQYFRYSADEDSAVA